MTMTEKKLRTELENLKSKLKDREETIKARDRQIVRLKDTVRMMERGNDATPILLAVTLAHGAMVSPTTTELTVSKAQMRRLDDFDLTRTDGPDSVVIRARLLRGMFGVEYG